MTTLGITGGIGSGKTTVCRLFESLGARVFYADAEGKRILAQDPDARQEIIDAFGAESYHDDGSLNRAYLAATVFQDEDQVETINRIVHPRVRRAFLDAKQAAADDGCVLLVYEAALIFETGGEQHLDAVAVVDAPKDTRIQRVMERDGVSREHVEARMAHQMPAAEKRRRATYVIHNTGTPDDLNEQVARIYKTVTGQPPPDKGA